MMRIRLIHWNQDEASVCAKKLRAQGFLIEADMPSDGTSFMRELRRNPPDAVVIDLSRLPMQGRDVALAMRAAKTTRQVPIVFVAGATEKVKRVREQLPDARYTTWQKIADCLRDAVAHPLNDPHIPASNLAGYAGTPLSKKLGIKANSSLALINAPIDFQTSLDQLPAGVTIRHHARGRPDVTLFFATTARDLERRIDRLVRLAEKGGLWIAWPKKASGLRTDVTQKLVRQIGLAAGLVDFKICSINEVWSGLRFTQRK